MSDMIGRLFGEQAGEFRQQCWPNVQRHLLVSGLKDRLTELFTPELTTSLDALLGAHRGTITAQGFDGQGHLHVALSLDVPTAKALLAHGVPVQLYGLQQGFPVIDTLVGELRCALGLPLSDAVPTIFISPRQGSVQALR